MAARRGREVEAPAAVGYAVAAPAYRRGRPSYPSAVVDAFVSEIGEGAVLDVGAGAGAMTELLAARDVRVVAVDRVREMLGEIDAPIPRVVASAQSLPVRSGSMTAVMVANAFHWFATAASLGEFHRCVGVGGLLALAWNERDESVPWVRRHTEIVDAYQGTAPRFRTMAWKGVMDADVHFNEVGYLEAPNPTPMTASRLVDRVLSTSFIAALGEAQRADVERQARDLAASLPEAFEYPYLSRLWLYRATEPTSSPAV